MSSPTLAAIGLGSNLGDREAHLKYAIHRLADVLANLRASSLLETSPVGVPGLQPLFLNAAAVGEARTSPDELLRALLAIERERGRQRPFAGAARTLDLDLLIYGDLISDQPGLNVPHPRFRERRFVLEPLAEIAPDLRDPVTLLTVRDLLARLPPELPVPNR